MAEIEIDQGRVAGSAPRADEFETTLSGKDDDAYVGCQLRFLTGSLARFSRGISSYRGRTGTVLLDESLPTPPTSGDAFVIERP